MRVKIKFDSSNAANNGTPGTPKPLTPEQQQQCPSIQQARAQARHTQRNKNLLASEPGAPGSRPGFGR